MLQISSCENPTSFIACLILMTPLAAATMPAALGNSSSSLTSPSNMSNEETYTVLAHFYQLTNEFVLVYSALHKMVRQKITFGAMFQGIILELD